MIVVIKALTNPCLVLMKCMLCPAQTVSALPEQRLVQVYLTGYLMQVELKEPTVAIGLQACRLLLQESDLQAHCFEAKQPWWHKT